MKKVICLLIIGDKYLNEFELRKEHFEAYAKKTDAELKIITTPPDPTFHRSLLVQKLLIPKLVMDYDLCLYLDLDVIINDSAPSVFNELPSDKSFGAVLDPRGSTEFLNTWKIKNETVEMYFSARNFPYNSNLVGSINGGVILFRPKQVATLFEEYYFSGHNLKYKEMGSYEEGPMAYISQSNQIFFPINAKYNTQLIFKIRGTDEGRAVLKKSKQRWRISSKGASKIRTTKAYNEYVNKILEESWILHFAGGFPMPGQ
ncbi:MAG: glycosyltransferase [Bacteroidota bacterium]|jgi:lipopolysaccharide biosynthesis glycosyltransferase